MLRVKRFPQNILANYKSYDFIKSPLDKSVAGFITGLNTIKYVSPDEDYDQFCKNNKV